MVPTEVPTGSFSATLKSRLLGNTGGLSLTSVSSTTTWAVPIKDDPLSLAVTVKVNTDLKDKKNAP